ncbi:MAG: hypothetical protein WC314_25300 [Vulcanimicrobiota bacterium]
MESPSHLESFLNELKASGQSQGQGHFTVAREKALEKLAEFQLPFQGAWIVKVVQAVVAFGVATPIAIGQTRRVTSIKFAGKPPCAPAYYSSYSHASLKWAWLPLPTPHPRTFE